MAGDYYVGRVPRSAWEEEAGALLQIGPSSSSSSPRLRQQQQDDEEAIGAHLPIGSSLSPPPVPQPRSTLNTWLTWTASLPPLLPTGTVLAFQLLAPNFTNHGAACDATTALLTFCLLAVLALACLLSSFTDSFRAADGRVYYGVATRRGLWLLDYPPGHARPDTATYRLAPTDYVHAALSVAVFLGVVARDKNVVGCFCGPAPAIETKEVLDRVPLAVGLLCSMLLVAFPTRRHGIGYPVTNGHLRADTLDLDLDGIARGGESSYDENRMHNV